MITKKTPNTEAADDVSTKPSAVTSRAVGGFWSFMKTFFVGTAGLALLAVIGTLAGNFWLTANQRAEAEKAAPWTNPSFTTTAATTGGMLARWMDSDGNLENGHSYIQGIYNLWKTRQDINSPASMFANLVSAPQHLAVLPPLWQIEFTRDAEAINKATQAQLDAKTREMLRATKQAELESALIEAQNIREYKKSLQVRTFTPE